MMKMNKKGIFFTFAAIALSVIILFSFNVYNEYRLNDKMEVIEIRINTMNNFIKDLENDIGNAIFIVGFRSLLSIEGYMMENDDFIDNLGTTLSGAFDEAFRLGTINSEKMILMQDNNFLNWTNRIKVQANKTGINLEFTINSGDVTISQSDPWTVEVKINNLKIDIKDTKNTASWTITKDYTKKINITSEVSGDHKFVDPLYLVFNNGLANNTIRQTTIPDFSSIANLQEHVDGRLPNGVSGSYYIANTDAPSYLNRFEEDTIFTASANGIESLVDVETVSGLGLGHQSSKTAVDHLYFDTTSSTSDCNIEDMGMSYDWFWLDFTGPNHKDGPYGGFDCTP